MSLLRYYKEISMTPVSKEVWLKEMPELIYKLKKDYGFYYSGGFCRIQKDILEVINKNKHKHKIVLYRRNQRFFLVVYRKSGPVIYFTNEYVDDKNWNRIKYFEKKFNRAYKRAEKEIEDELFKSYTSE